MNTRMQSENLPFAMVIVPVHATNVFYLLYTYLWKRFHFVRYGLQYAMPNRALASWSASCFVFGIPLIRFWASDVRWQLISSFHQTEAAIFPMQAMIPEDFPSIFSYYFILFYRKLDHTRAVGDRYSSSTSETLNWHFVVCVFLIAQTNEDRPGNHWKVIRNYISSMKTKLIKRWKIKLNRYKVTN